MYGKKRPKTAGDYLTQSTASAVLRAVIAALAIMAVSPAAAAEAIEETHGEWRVMCEDRICTAYQYGVGGRAPVILRIKRGMPPAPEMRIEGGPFEASGLVKFVIDGKDVGGGPAAPGGSGEVETIVLESDDITLGLSRQMKKAASLSIEVPAIRGAEIIKFSLDGYGSAMKRVENR